MKARFLALSALLWGLSASAQLFDPSISLNTDVRIDYQREYTDGHTDDANTGFKGKYLNFRLDGQFNKYLSFSYRQRMNKFSSDATFFDATDWVYLTYRPDDRWQLSAGKQVVGVGGFEYDRAPIDIYRASEFWNNVACYQMGASVGYNLTPRDMLNFQVCESPFHYAGNSNMYAYNLQWFGNHGWFQSIYSFNVMEYAAGKYITYIALGNKFNIGKASLELDLMNRASNHQTYLFKDCSVMAELSYQVSNPVKLFGKFTYDVNKSGNGSDLLVLDGTDMKMVGAGVEYHPLKTAKHDVRLHAFCFYSFGTNSNPSGTLQDKMTMVDIGIKWRFDILNNKKLQ
jgi:hypothetical protein